MLTDDQIRDFINKGKITIEPFDDKNLKAGKYDVHLGKYILIPQNIDQIIDPENALVEPEYGKVYISEEPFVLMPGQFVLGQTEELIGLDADVGMFIDGRTTVARLGLTVHISATYIPPGQDPHIITLEIFNAGPWKIQLAYKLRIGKVIAFQYEKNNVIPAKIYNRYNGQKEVTGAKIKETS